MTQTGSVPSAPRVGVSRAAVPVGGNTAKVVRILLVDDDEDDFILTRDMLADIGGTRFELDWATGYDEGLAAVSLREHDAYLFDYRLGDFDGLDLLREARALGCTAPMIMLSGMGDHSVDLAAMEAGAADYLAKDAIDPDRLERALRYSLDRAQTRHRLEALVRAKDEFIASVSHEMRTPLTAVLGFAEVLREEWSESVSPEAREMMEVIAREAKDAANIVEDLLVAAQPEKLSIAVELLDLRVEAERVVTELQLGESVAVVGSGSARQVQADPFRIRQIVRNLLVNATRYGGEQVGIEVSGDPDEVTLEVWDDGPGVAGDAESSIFEPYFSTSGSGYQPGAMGLGLSVSRSLALLMGGDLTYHHSPGRCGFRLVLPESAPHPQPDDTR